MNDGGLMTRVALLFSVLFMLIVYELGIPIFNSRFWIQMSMIGSHL